jgi:uncharacterized membrane protein YtjA (UPF0391 family)
MSYAYRRRTPTVIPTGFPDTSATRRLLLKIRSFRGAHMLHYAAVFFVIALIAAFFGFGGIAVGAAGIAKILFIVFLIGAVVTFLMSLGRRV